MRRPLPSGPLPSGQAQRARARAVGPGWEGPLMSVGRHAFDFLHGSWRVSHRVLRERLLDCDLWDEHAGDAVCTPILGGVGNLDEIGLPHQDALGATLRLYDRDADQWTLHWSSSRTGRLDPPMTGTFADGVGTFLGRDQLRGGAIDVRFVWDDIGPSSARWTQAFCWADGGEWETNWVMNFRRTSTGRPALSSPGPFRFA